MSNSEQEQIELETISIEHAVSMGEAWKRLQKHGDFKKVIMNGYLQEKILASVSLLAVPQMRDRRGEIMEDIISASNLQFFFRVIEHEYEGAVNPILSDEEEEEVAKKLAEQAQANLK